MISLTMIPLESTPCSAFFLVKGPKEAQQPGRGTTVDQLVCPALTVKALGHMINSGHGYTIVDAGTDIMSQNSSER
jgi:hypothetical protein